jgi:hypothetical protein
MSGLTVHPEAFEQLRTGLSKHQRGRREYYYSRPLFTTDGPFSFSKNCLCIKKKPRLTARGFSVLARRHERRGKLVDRKRGPASPLDDDQGSHHVMLLVLQDMTVPDVLITFDAHG